ncbi:Endonuclease/exonuclease/phosphatase, partial [Mycena sanguinolenta]
NQLASYHPSRLIVNLRDAPTGAGRLSEREVVQVINTRLSEHEESKHLIVTAARYNNKSSCIIFTREDQTAEELQKHERKFIGDLARGGRATTLLDTPWHKIQIHGMYTGYPEGRILTGEEVWAELCRNSPSLAKMELLHPPRWMRSVGDMEREGQTSSSVVVALKNEEDATALLARRMVAGFARFCDRRDFAVTLRSDIAKDLDIQVLDIIQAPHPTTTVVNIYSAPRGKGSRRRRRDAVQRLQHLPLPLDSPVIISGDVNKYHSSWGIGNRAAAGPTEIFVEWLDENGFTLQNEKGVPTYFEHAKRGATSTIDLTFTNTPATALDVTKEWAVDGTLASGSDHHALRWIIDYGVAEVENPMGIKYNFAKIDGEKWDNTFRSAIEHNRERWEHLKDEGRERTTTELDEDARLILAAMSKAT